VQSFKNSDNSNPWFRHKASSRDQPEIPSIPMNTYFTRRTHKSPFARTLAGFGLGLGILAMLQRRSPTAARISRPISNAANLALLAASLGLSLSRRPFSIVTATIAGVTALNQYRKARRSDNRSDNQLGDGCVHLRESVTINRSPGELYQFWRNFENLPRFMNHLHEVQQTSNDQSRWIVSGPLGTRLEWTAEIINETPNKLIAWRSLEGGDVDSAGTVRFETTPDGRGTIVKVEMEYRPPAGKLGAAVAKFLGAGAAKQVAVDLHRFKQLMETGEVART
jgi:uncharacterized membrane protein